MYWLYINVNACLLFCWYNVFDQWLLRREYPIDCMTVDVSLCDTQHMRKPLVCFIAWRSIHIVLFSAVIPEHVL
jgi:hypothetical protein